jgi:GT2 family glycosyltransferase
LLPRIVIIVLNWNNAPATISCLDSLRRITYPASETLVVDNGSIDDSVALIRASFHDITVLETGANLGYAGGNNVGIRCALESGADYVCIVNNDVMATPGFLDLMVEALQKDPNAGVATPLLAEQADGVARVWALGSFVNRYTASVSRQYAEEKLDSWREKEPFEVEITSGAAMLVRAEVFERAGLMDEDFFLYFEETDWSLRVRQAGYRILAVPSSVVWHEVSATLGAASPIIDYYMLRNHLRFIGRHWSAPGRQLLWSCVFLRNLLAVVAFTAKSQRGRRLANRNARLLAMRDALHGRWGEMGPDVLAACQPG